MSSWLEECAGELQGPIMETSCIIQRGVAAVGTASTSSASLSPQFFSKTEMVLGDTAGQLTLSGKGSSFLGMFGLRIRVWLISPESAKA